MKRSGWAEPDKITKKHRKQFSIKSICIFSVPFCNNRCPVDTFSIVLEYQHMVIYRLIVHLLRKMTMAFCFWRFQMQIIVCVCVCLVYINLNLNKQNWSKFDYETWKKKTIITKSSPLNSMMKLFMSHTAAKCYFIEIWWKLHWTWNFIG